MGAGAVCGECSQRKSFILTLSERNNKSEPVTFEILLDGFVEKVLLHSSQHAELDLIKPLLLDDEYVSLHFYKYLKNNDSSAAERYLSFFRVRIFSYWYENR
jgi:hypothetical protein